MKQVRDSRVRGKNAGQDPSNKKRKGEIISSFRKKNARKTQEKSGEEGPAKEEIYQNVLGETGRCLTTGKGVKEVPETARSGTSWFLNV